MTKIERETVVSFNMAEGHAEIATRMKSVKTKMRKLGIKPNKAQADYEVYKVPKNYVRIGPPRKVGEKQRKSASERLRAWHREKKRKREK